MNATFSISEAPAELKDLYRAALLAREKSYSPYSGYKVGSAIRLQDGTMHTGCNVENSSYGATVCAERVAVQKAVSERGKPTILEVMVVTDAQPAWPPCGVCRQVIAEFGGKARVHMANLQGELRTMGLDELLPQAFTPEHLSARNAK